MRQKMIQAAPAPKKNKPKSEFEAFDALATKLLNVPKSAIASSKKARAKRTQSAKKRG